MTPDKSYEILFNRAFETKKEKEQLENNYANKFKGEVYYTQIEVLTSRLAGYQKRLEKFGTEINLVKVYGYLIKTLGDGETKIREDFTMFLTNINPDDALTVAKLTVPGYQSAAALEIKLGFVNTLK